MYPGATFFTASYSLLRAAGDLLGVLQHSPEQWRTIRRGVVDDADAINELVNARNAARARKDFQDADRVRDVLGERGIVLEDGPDGTQWRKVD